MADNRLFADKIRPFPHYPVITYLSNGAGHQYHSLTFEAKRRCKSGLEYQLSWVRARDIGDLERGESPENAYVRKRERGVWLDIPTHRITGKPDLRIAVRQRQTLGECGKPVGQCSGGRLGVVGNLEPVLGSIPYAAVDRSRSNRYRLHQQSDSGPGHHPAE